MERPTHRAWSTIESAFLCVDAQSLYRPKGTFSVDKLKQGSKAPKPNIFHSVMGLWYGQRRFTNKDLDMFEAAANKIKHVENAQGQTVYWP